MARFWPAILGAALLFAAPAPADLPVLLDAEGFAARVTGQTIYWEDHGALFGAEQYLPGRRVIWRAQGDLCAQGAWFADGPYICFRYEDTAGPVCWAFAELGGRLIARPRHGAWTRVLRAAKQSPAPLSCAAGPSV